MIKNYHEVALESFKSLQAQNEQMITLFMDQMQKENLKLDKNYKEWLDDTRKAFNDYQKLILKGLEYLSVCFDRNGNKPGEKE